MVINQKKWAIIFGSLFIFFILAWWDLYQGLILIGNKPSLESKRFVVFLVFQIVPLFVWGSIFRIIRVRKLDQGKWFAFLDFVHRIPQFIRILLSIGILFLPPYMFLVSTFGDYQIGYWFRLAAIIFCGFLATVLLFPKKLDMWWWLRFSSLVMVTAVVFITCDWFTEVTSYPFSLAWSEGNRMWDYSMLFGSDRYINLSGEPIFTFIEVGRQVLFAIPFLLPNLDIFGFRLWSVLIWIIPPLLLGAALVLGRPYSGKKLLGQLGFILWIYLFLSQGPIYPPLLLSAALVVVGIRSRSWVFGMIAVALAAYYCEMSRWTWMYAPGLWAGMLTLMDADQPSFTREGWKKLIKPVVFGLTGYFGGEFLPRIIDAIGKGSAVAIEGVKAIRVPSQFSQPMLWERLFPNPTYPTGILLGTLWVGLPIILFLFWMWKAKVWKANWIQTFPIIGLVGIFMVLGIIVSVKIGGGSNLHNLDMLWVTLALVTGWIWKRWMNQGFAGMQEDKRLFALLCLVLIMPFTTMVDSGHPLRLPEDRLVNESVQKIQDAVKDAQKVGEVLFIDQRQLLTFGYVKDVPLVSEYEKKYLMDRAVVEDTIYLHKFYKDLEELRFSLIISEPMRRSYAEEDIRNFGQENNAWVGWISRPLLKYYKPLVTLDEVGVQLLVPR